MEVEIIKDTQIWFIFFCLLLIVLKLYINTDISLLFTIVLQTINVISFINDGTSELEFCLTLLLNFFISDFSEADDDNDGIFGIEGS